MNLKWLVAIGLILILVITPVSASRGGEGKHMGWLKTPDFKNGGFEEGNISNWSYGDDVPASYYGGLNYRPGAIVTKVYATGGDYSLWLYRPANWARDPDEGMDENNIWISQEVRLNGATGISFWYIPFKTGVSDPCTLTISVGTVEVYNKTITTYTSGVWINDFATVTGYTGRHVVKFNEWSVGDDNTGLFLDDIHLVGPGF